MSQSVRNRRDPAVECEQDAYDERIIEKRRRSKREFRRVKKRRRNRKREF